MAPISLHDGTYYHMLFGTSSYIKHTMYKTLQAQPGLGFRCSATRRCTFQLHEMCLIPV